MHATTSGSRISWLLPPFLTRICEKKTGPPRTLRRAGLGSTRRLHMALCVNRRRGSKNPGTLPSVSLVPELTHCDAFTHATPGRLLLFSRISWLLPPFSSRICARGRTAPELARKTKSGLGLLVGFIRTVRMNSRLRLIKITCSPRRL